MLPSTRSRAAAACTGLFAAIFLAIASTSMTIAQPPAPPPATPTAGDDAGLYVVVEATQRPLDAMLVLPALCSLPRAACEVVDQVLFNDTRLSGILRPLKANAGVANQVMKAPPPAFAIGQPAAIAAGAQYVLGVVVKPAKQAGHIDVIAAAIDVRDGQLLPLGDYAHQVGSQEAVRSLAHRVLNGVHGALTGVEGSFDTVIFYSGPAPSCNRAIWAMDADGFNRRVLVADGGKQNGIHMFPMQNADGGLSYMSFRTGMPSLFKMEAAQLNALIDLTPTVPKSVKPKRTGAKGATVAGSDVVGPPTPFAKGTIDQQFRGLAQNARGDLVATINDGDQADIWALDATGNPFRNLTGNEADDLGPVFSPDGVHIAFVSDRTGSPQVYVMEFDGANPRRMTFAGPYNTDPDWGPDGKIAYSGMRGDAIDVLTVDLNNKMQRLTPGLGRRSLEPSWSPDGKRIVYCSNEDGTRNLRLWVTSHDGAAREPLDVPPGLYYTPSWQRISGKVPKKWTAKAP
jgi:Tol biopolymer transport system component